MNIDLKLGDCIEGMKSLADGSVDVILTDPPYKYLKNQKLEVDFDEPTFFAQVKRVLTKNGFIIIFGRGTSFYRWCTMLAELGFTFKEEFIWDKGQSSSPVLPISRVHETAAFFTKGKGVINRVKVPYFEMRNDDINSVIKDVKRLRVLFSNKNSLDLVEKYLENAAKGVICNKRPDYVEKQTLTKFSSTVKDCKSTDRQVTVINSIENGMSEKSIIRITRSHYSAIHPTEKPVALLVRLLNMVSIKGIKVCDPFSGSGSTAVACIEKGVDFIGWELDDEYYMKSTERIQASFKI